MVTDCVIQNQEAIMKSSHVLYRKIWILRIKRVNISITKPRIIEGINCHINTGILLCQNIKRPNIHISIYQNNFLGRLLPRPFFEVTICDLKESYSSCVN